jgi:hypothetical protein
MDRPWDARNTESLALYEQLLAGLSDAQLEHVFEDGWSNGAILCHLAFWDRRASVLIKRWQANGIGETSGDVHAINDASLPLQLKVPAAIARQEFFEAAGEAHDLIASISDELIEGIIAEGSVSLDRSNHRQTHLRDLQRSA